METIEYLAQRKVKRPDYTEQMDQAYRESILNNIKQVKKDVRKKSKQNAKHEEIVKRSESATNRKGVHEIEQKDKYTSELFGILYKSI